jgi:hypothetical protein
MPRSLYFPVEILVTIADEQARWIDEYRSQRTLSRKAAIRELIGLGLKTAMESQSPEESGPRPVLSPRRPRA